MGTPCDGGVTVLSGDYANAGEVRSPDGTFYITPRAPIEDDVAYSDILAKEGLFCLPGSVVSTNGYLRASLTANDDMIERALPIFAAARQKVQ
jgi:aspartate aminotransferase